jgi:hypothetical protein
MSSQVNLSAKGLYLPSWAIGLAVAAIIFVVSLGVESRLRLGVHEARIDELRQQVERNQAASEATTRELREGLQRVQLHVAAICAATGARCP